jgi:hypothetical protein
VAASIAHEPTLATTGKLSANGNADVTKKVPKDKPVDGKNLLLKYTFRQVLNVSVISSFAKT